MGGDGRAAGLHGPVHAARPGLPVTARRPAARFEIVVHGPVEHGTATRSRIGLAASEHSALSRATEVIKQWADSHGATRPGTRIDVIDLNDGGKLFTATYLGYAPSVLSGEGW